MNKLFLLCLMIFFGIVDDFYLQNTLGNLKQKYWWETHYPQKIYRNDYIVALLIHSFSWSFMIMIPVMIYGTWMIEGLIINLIIHAIVDHLKANKHCINLWVDQVIHLLQILWSWWAWIYFR